MPGRQTATQIALQPEECGPVIKFTVLFTKEVQPLPRLPRQLALTSPHSFLLCVQRTVEEVSEGRLSLASPANNVRNVRRNETTLPPPPALRPTQITLGPHLC